MQAVYDFFVGEWYFSIPLVMMSLVGLALVLWRLMLNGSARTDMDDFLPVFQETLRKRGVWPLSVGHVVCCARAVAISMHGGTTTGSCFASRRPAM